MNCSNDLSNWLGMRFGSRVEVSIALVDPAPASEDLSAEPGWVLVGILPARIAHLLAFWRAVRLDV